MFTRHVLLAVACVLTASACATAQVPWNDRGGPRPYDDGYAFGLRAGVDDGQRGRPFSYTDEPAYRQAGRIDEGRWDTRSDDRDEFRRGFANGYDIGYRDAVAVRSPGRPGLSDRFGTRTDLARQNGFDDGYAAGRNDAGNGDRFDPITERRYRDAERGYEDWYGPREAYRDRYRVGFRTGYEIGYRENSGRR